MKTTTNPPACRVMFSPEDFDLTLLTWSRTRGGYFKHAKHKGKKYTDLFAHRVVASRATGRELGRWDFVDHINHDLTDCRRENLRVVDPSQSRQNTKRHLNPYVGTSKCSDSDKWAAQVKHRGKTYYLGRFSDRAEAAKAARLKREELGFLTNRPSALNALVALGKGTK